MSYTQKTVRGGNLNRGSNQPGASKHVLPATNSHTVQRVVETDPLADYGEEGYDLMDVLDSMNAGDSVQVEDFKEEEYELEEYVVLDRSESADAPLPKRIRFDSDTSTGSSFSRQFQTTGRATPVTNKVIVQSSQLAGSAGTPVKKPLICATPTYMPVVPRSNAATKSSQVRVVPTERLRMPTTTNSNSVNAGTILPGVQGNLFTVPPEKKTMVQYAPIKTTAGSPVVQVNQNVKSGPTPPPLQAYGTKQLHVKIVPLNMLNMQQKQQLKAPLAGIASAVKGDQLAADSLRAGAGNAGAMSISVVPITQNNSSTSQGYTLSTNSVKLMAPLGTNVVNPSVNPPAPSPNKRTVVQLKNSSVTITRVVPPIPEPEEKCTVDLDALDSKQSVLQEDPLATSFEQPVSVQQSTIVPVLQAITSITPGDPLATGSEPPVSVQQGSTSHTVSRMIPIRKPISAITPGDPLATNSSHQPTVVQLMNTSLTVTRLGDQSAVQGDPLATGSEQPPAPRPTSTSLTVTRIVPSVPQNGLQSVVNVGASTSTKPPPPAQLKKPTVTVTKIATSNVPQSTPSAKAAPVRTPTVTARPNPQRPLSNVQYMRKKCDCRVEIAKRLKLLDERTRQMESYMNDLIDLIQPETDFEVSPITNREELERLNYDLGSSPQYLQKVKSWLDRRINARESHWRMVDAMNLLFDNNFLTKCSWKHSSKIPLYSYTYMIELFKFIGATPQVKVTIVCVGNFFMRQIKSILSKAKKISQESTAKDGDNPENASNEEQATNEEGVTKEKDAAHQEDTTVQNDTTVQKETNDRVDTSNQEDTTNVSHNIIEQEINNQDGEEYLDDEYLEDPTYEDDSQTMSSDN